jgi:elongation factor P--beta-lysine ligase
LDRESNDSHVTGLELQSDWRDATNPKEQRRRKQDKERKNQSGAKGEGLADEK